MTVPVNPATLRRQWLFTKLCVRIRTNAFLEQGMPPTSKLFNILFITNDSHRIRFDRGDISFIIVAGALVGTSLSTS